MYSTTKLFFTEIPNMTPKCPPLVFQDEVRNTVAVFYDKLNEIWNSRKASSEYTMARYVGLRMEPSLTYQEIGTHIVMITPYEAGKIFKFLVNSVWKPDSLVAWQ